MPHVCNQGVLPQDSELRRNMTDHLQRGEVALAVAALEPVVEARRMLDLPLAMQLLDACVEARAWHLIVDGLFQ